MSLSLVFRFFEYIRESLHHFWTWKCPIIMSDECNTVFITQNNSRPRVILETSMSTENNSFDDIYDDYHSKLGTNVPEECDLCVLADQRVFYLQ